MLGDGIRRNIASVTKEERDRFRDAILALGSKLFPGAKTDPIPGGVSYWFKQDEIHDSTHVHFCPAFLPWHRELMRRFEAMLREIDPALSLHYWDWTADPQNLTDSDGNPLNLFTPDFMGNAIGAGNTEIEIGPPWKSAAVPGLFYGAAAGQDRETTLNPADPPATVTRQVGANGGLISTADEQTVLSAPDFVAFDNQMEGTGVNIHGQGHNYIGGDLLDPHTSFRDPFVFLMHSNIDRLFAMWQRQHGHPERLDPAQLYKAQSTGHNGFESTKGGDRTTIDPPGTSQVGDDDVSSLHPWWGILSPEEPWAGPSAQTKTTGIILNVKSVRPFAPPENQQIFKDSRDPSIVVPPSYDTAPHSSYFIVNRDTFSNSEIALISGVPTFPYGPATSASAFYVVYDGFEPKELGVTSTPLPTVPPNLPTFAFTSASHITAVNPSASYEDPSGAIDMPQRITISYDLQFSDGSDFPAASGGEVLVNIQANLTYNVDTGTGGTIVSVSEVANTELLLVNQPNPYMIDTQPGDPSPYWLSVDTRVFQVKKGDVRGGGPAGPNGPATQGDLGNDSNAPFEFIQQVVRNFNSLANDSSHPFLTQLSEDEAASQLELSQKVGGQRVYNYAVAKVRYLAPTTVDAGNVSAFFRVFSTAVSSLDYDATSGTTGNYRRTGNVNGSSVPLLGIENDSQGQPETASIPFFASARVPQTASMTTQPPDTTNVQTITGTGSENVAYFGVWLDMNLAPGDPNFRQFPLNPLADPGGPDGPYTGPVQSVQQLMLGTHHCMVAEVFFWPGIASDPIPHDASPASSDRLAQRNLVLVKSGNPGYPATHTVQHTFLVKPSISSVDQVAAQFRSSQAKRGKRGAGPQAAAAVVTNRLRGPDELLIRWNNLPRKTEATFYLPEIEVDEILALSALRQHPTVLKKVDAHTLRCHLADVTYIPLPARKGTLAGLMSLILPQGIRTGQVYKLSVEQYSGYTHKTLGAFQMTIPVRPDPEILPEEIRKLSVMRYIQQAIPAGSRWVSIFTRYVDQIAARVRGFGGDPDGVKPSPDGGEGGEICPPPCRPEVCPPDLLCLNIPWKECDIEGELDLKVRFRRRCK
jgi:hypothetical protein